MTTPYSTYIQEDGARTAYEVHGQHHLGKRIPLVLVAGTFMVRGDWERLLKPLSECRPVLIFDHRGIGNSTFSTKGDERFGVERMARDALALIVSLGWTEVAICGYSMGGTVTQQLLFLPFHPSKPTSLPFRVTHVFLMATLCEPYRNISLGEKLQALLPPPNRQGWTLEEERELARPTAEAIFDPTWISNNPERWKWWLDRIVIDRPIQTVLMQARASYTVNFAGFHARLPMDLKIMVVHGKLDGVLPYSHSRSMFKHLPWATGVEIGNRPGQLPNLDFSHHWFEYFDIKVWRDFFEIFLNDPAAPRSARL